jgi:hypothetical protein
VSGNEVQKIYAKEKTSPPFLLKFSPIHTESDPPAPPLSRFSLNDPVICQITDDLLPATRISTIAPSNPPRIGP